MSLPFMLAQTKTPLLYCGFESEAEILEKGEIIYRFNRSPYDEISFVPGYKGMGMMIRGFHDRNGFDANRST